MISWSTQVSSVAHRLCRTTTRSVASHAVRQTHDLTLYQYAICPFCHKTKALLNYSGTSYKAVEVNPLTQAEIKPLLPPSQKRGKVPIMSMVATQGDEPSRETKLIHGSNEIIQALLQLPSVKEGIASKGGLADDGETDQKETAFWTSFVDDELAPVLYPNICRSLGEAYRTFDYVQNVESFSTLQKASIRALGSVAMYMAASRVKSKCYIVCNTHIHTHYSFR